MLGLKPMILKNIIHYCHIYKDGFQFKISQIFDKKLLKNLKYLMFFFSKYILGTFTQNFENHHFFKNFQIQCFFLIFHVFHNIQGF